MGRYQKPDRSGALTVNARTSLCGRDTVTYFISSPRRLGSRELSTRGSIQLITTSLASAHFYNRDLFDDRAKNFVRRVLALKASREEICRVHRMDALNNGR